MNCVFQVRTSGKKHDRFLFPYIIYSAHTELFNIAIRSDWVERITQEQGNKFLWTQCTQYCVSRAINLDIQSIGFRSTKEIERNQDTMCSL